MISMFKVSVYMVSIFKVSVFMVSINRLTITGDSISFIKRLFAFTLKSCGFQLLSIH